MIFTPIKCAKRKSLWQSLASMCRKGDFWDNASMERFFGSLKSERLASCRFATRKAEETEILDYITITTLPGFIPRWDIKVPCNTRKNNF